MVVDKKRKDGCESHTFENHEKRDNSFSQEFFINLRLLTAIMSA